MKKVILAIGMILPMMLQAQINVFSAEMTNEENKTVGKITVNGVKIENIDKSTEIAVNIIFTETGTNQKEKVTGEKTSLVVYSIGDRIVIESLPNETFNIVTTTGIVVASGKLDIDGNNEIEDTLESGTVYVVSVGNNISEKIKK